MIFYMKILTRKAVPGDGKAIIECLNESCSLTCNECVNRYACNNKFFPQDPAYIDKRLLMNNGSTIIALDKNLIVGLALFTVNKFSKTQHRAECGWFVRKSYMKQGIATKLVKELIKEAKKKGLRRLEAESAVSNEASLRLAEKLGFEKEGIKQKALMLDNGKLEDTYILGRIL